MQGFRYEGSRNLAAAPLSISKLPDWLFVPSGSGKAHSEEGYRSLMLSPGWVPQTAALWYNPY